MRQEATQSFRKVIEMVHVGFVTRQESYECEKQKEGSMASVL